MRILDAIDHDKREGLELRFPFVRAVGHRRPAEGGRLDPLDTGEDFVEEAVAQTRRFGVVVISDVVDLAIDEPLIGEVHAVFPRRSAKEARNSFSERTHEGSESISLSR